MAGSTAVHNLATFQLSDMLELGHEIRRLGIDCDSMEEAAGKVVRYLYHGLADSEGNRCCALVRCFKTHPYAALNAEMQAAACAALVDPGMLEPNTQCLTLLATAGDQPEWNDRRRSRGHQAIPLPSVDILRQAPMVAQLLQQMGLDLARILKPDPSLLIDIDQRTFNVFHVQDAEGSPYVPAQQDFVVRYKIRSVLGFGGLLPSAELFAVIMFSRVPIPRNIAEMFSTLALGVKPVLIPFLGPRTFAVTRVS
jgi:hypothetical protein